eukprot:CAMPEP_0172322014 /NCGR_PEP_ID=MMETSP1058-20130122/44802_1 /TAXON_ID=83371 /ORGANISM="Detonula confervacea, Strain CCMP 353" /LENGTH=135 /DNA_ID=CAMNT_0013037645 /DNA_START=87 /DNA_END=491 /DNA_ORIENTATION=-
MNQTFFTRSSLFQPTKHELTAAEEAHQKKQHAKRRAKRRKPRWKDRVAPATTTTTANEPKEDIIDEATLTRCTRCPIHRNQPGRFRPLIGNGEYLCKPCYQAEFPCTAMLDEDDDDQPEWQRMGKHASNILRNTV